MHIGSKGRRRSKKRYENRTKRVGPSKRKAEFHRRPTSDPERNLIPSHSQFLPPIEDAEKEKRILETRGQLAWVRWLAQRIEPTNVIFHEQGLELRLCELYRLSFLGSGGRNLSAVADFAARYPDLVFRCQWILDLVRVSARIRDFDRQARRFFTALGLGFRRAGTARSWERHSLSSRVEGARIVQKTLKEELTIFREEMKPREATPDWLGEKIGQKVQEIVAVHSQLANRKNEIRSLLAKGKIYKASVLIAAKTFHVRERDIKSSTGSR